MAMHEVAAAVAPHANYLLASEGLEPGDGWDYRSLGDVTAGQQLALASSGGASGMAAADVGAALVRSYLSSSQAAGAVGLTLALVDLGAQRRLGDDLSALARALVTQLAGAGGNGACDGRVGGKH